MIFEHIRSGGCLSYLIGCPKRLAESELPFVDLRVENGELLLVGDLRIQVIYTPGHTEVSLCLSRPGGVLTGDTLLIGGTGRTDLPSGDPEALHSST